MALLEVKNLHTIEKTTYNVSIEDKYMYYEYEYQSLGEIEGYRSDCGNYGEVCTWRNDQGDIMDTGRRRRNLLLQPCED